METKNDIKVSVGRMSIVLNEDILKRIKLLQECYYMQDELNRINKKIIDLYNDNLAGCGGDISPEEAMQMVSILKDAMEDYAFLTGLDVKDTGPQTDAA